MHRFDNFIAGEWLAGAHRRPNVNPSDTNDVIGEYAQAKEPWFDSAHTAMEDWAARTGWTAPA